LVGEQFTKIISFISFPLFYFFLLALFYWVGTEELHDLDTPFLVFSTILFVVTTYFFAFYVSKIARYNVLYGSIGSIILLMIWVNVNVILLLLGNELKYRLES
jgi:membrane protein